MKRLVPLLLSALAVLGVAGGCGSPEPTHAVQPLTERPAVSNPFPTNGTPEAKIRFIQDSKAPQGEKDKAIAQVRAGIL